MLKVKRSLERATRTISELIVRLYRQTLKPTTEHQAILELHHTPLVLAMGLHLLWKWAILYLLKFKDSAISFVVYQ